MSMFCYQCQETAKNTGCTIKGVCGKDEEVARLQDLLVYATKGIAEIVIRGKLDPGSIRYTSQQVIKSLFMTITNANFDSVAIERQIRKLISLRDGLKESVDIEDLHDAASFALDAKDSMMAKA